MVQREIEQGYVMRRLNGPSSRALQANPRQSLAGALFYMHAFVRMPMCNNFDFVHQILARLGDKAVASRKILQPMDLCRFHPRRERCKRNRVMRKPGGTAYVRFKMSALTTHAQFREVHPTAQSLV